MATSPRTPASTAAAVRRSQASRARSDVRAQLVESQRRRREWSFALFALRQGLREFRNEMRMRLRQPSHAVRKA